VMEVHGHRGRLGRAGWHCEQGRVLKAVEGNGGRLLSLRRRFCPEHGTGNCKTELGYGEGTPICAALLPTCCRYGGGGGGGYYRGGKPHQARGGNQRGRYVEGETAAARDIDTCIAWHHRLPQLCLC